MIIRPLHVPPLRLGLAAVLLLGLAALPASAQTVAEFLKAPTPAADPTIARVDKTEIHRSDLAAALATMPPQVQQMQMSQIYPLLVDRMVDIKLIAAAGRAAGLANDPAVKRKVADAEDRAIQDSYVDSKVKAQITDDAVRSKYQQELKDNPPEEEVHARHILVASEADAKAIIAQLQKGADFAALAKSKSTDGSAKEGGDLGFFTHDDMVAEFADAAFAMKPGEISKQPVKTQFGYHVIKVEERRTQPTPSFDESKDEISGELQQELMAAMVKDLRAKAKVERFDIDGKPAAAAPGPALLAPAKP
jgi:peptidyl-prolyl cis-trans isomerase C